MVMEIRIVDYDPAWPDAFSREAARLLGLFERGVARIEHIGSTAVPGLGAKPIIDLMLGARELSDIEAVIPAIESLGYEYVPRHEAEMPERRFFRKEKRGRRTHHLHAVEFDGAFWRDHLLFRDFLRSHADVARAYCELKVDLAGRFFSDREAYMDGKDPFIKRVLERVRAGES
jgi:GrpB-like predicted nucleotidyltransferase (UPF0157 family)